MSVLEDIMQGISAGRETYMSAAAAAETGITQPSGAELSQLALGDNIEYMKFLLSNGYRGSFRQIYIDPPFFTRAKFNSAVVLKDSSGKSHRIKHLAFDDRFERSLECYIENMTSRLLLMKDLLSDDGTLWVHLDWHSSHYIKLVLDEVMGEKNFVNEIVWCYKSGGSGKKHFSRKHDTILVYSKTKNYYIDIPEEKSYNRGFKPYNFKGVREYCDEDGWYTLVNMKDVWSVNMVGRTSAERNGYATQKPLELMNRIICAGSKEGDLVGDFFCGSGSYLEAAELLGRRWAGCDNEQLAVSMARKRLNHTGGDFACVYMDEERIIPGRADITIKSTEALENGQQMIKCAVTDFVPDVDMGYIQNNDRQYVESALRGDTLQMIDYIIFDTGRGNSVVREGGFDEILLMCDELAEATIVDVFGQEYRAEIIR